MPSGATVSAKPRTSEAEEDEEEGDEECDASEMN